MTHRCMSTLPLLICRASGIRAQMLAPHATDPRDGHGGFPIQQDQDAHGASRCLLFIHGFKTVIAMQAAHAAMTSIMSHHPPIDYRLARWRHVPVYGSGATIWRGLLWG